MTTIRYKILRLLWYKTHEELNAELDIKPKPYEVPRDYYRKAWILDKANISIWMKYPKIGQIYKSKEDYQVRYLTLLRAPYTGGGDAIFPKGEKIRIGLFWIKEENQIGDKKPILNACAPLDYERLQSVIIPEDILHNPKYGGYYLSISTRDLNTKFKLCNEDEI